MIRQQVGDILEIQFEGRWYYVVVLSKVVMLGGTIVFVFYNDGLRMSLAALMASTEGFNICTDLLLPKKSGNVTRLSTVADTSNYFKTRYARGTFVTRPTVKAQLWYIYHLDDLRNHIAIVRSLSSEYRKAMDCRVYSFDLVCEKIMARYSPEQDNRI